MKAITVTDPNAGTAGMTLTEQPGPHVSENDVLVRVHASGFTPGELAWPGTWTDRAGRDRTPSIPGHELSGVVTELGYGTTGFTIGQRVFGLADWTRNGTLAEYVVVEARNLAALPAHLAGKLRDDGADPARGAVHQDGLPGGHVAVVEQALPGGEPGDRQAGRGDVVDVRLRHRHRSYR